MFAHLAATGASLLDRVCAGCCAASACKHQSLFGLVGKLWPIHMPVYPWPLCPNGGAGGERGGGGGGLAHCRSADVFSACADVVTPCSRERARLPETEIGRLGDTGVREREGDHLYPSTHTHTHTISNMSPSVELSASSRLARTSFDGALAAPRRRAAPAFSSPR